MKVYLASPQSQLQAHAVTGMPVLVSYANYQKWMDTYLPSYDSILIDSGAFSEHSGRATVDVVQYVEWAAEQRGVDAYAGLDDITGDWKRSLANYKRGGFPTMHETDPPELLPDLVDIARERGRWIGIGLIPDDKRRTKEHIVKRILDGIPEDFHVHGWALRSFAHLPRIKSVDSTNWWRDAFKVRMYSETQHLTYGECLEIIVKRYQRETRKATAAIDSDTLSLFAEPAA